jgi:hypothetical protein
MIRSKPERFGASFPEQNLKGHDSWGVREPRYSQTPPVAKKQDPIAVTTGFEWLTRVEITTATEGQFQLPRPEMVHSMIPMLHRQ